MVKGLRAAGVPIEWVNDDKSPKLHRHHASVKIMTHSSRGFEFPIVAIPGLGFMPHGSGDAHEEAKLLYVAITRAMDQLLLTYHKRSEFVEKLTDAQMCVAA